MKRILALTMVLSLSLTFGIIVFAAGPDIFMNWAGAMEFDYTNGTYDFSLVGLSADAVADLAFGATDVDATVSILDSLNYIRAGCAGSDPLPDNPDFVTMTVTDGVNTIGTFVEFQKIHNQHPPTKVDEFLLVDFTTGEFDVYNDFAGLGDYKTTTQIQGGDEYVHVLTTFVNVFNGFLKNQSTGVFGDWTTCDGKGAYSAPDVTLLIVDVDGTVVAGIIDGGLFDFVGNLLDLHLLQDKGDGWIFDIDVDPIGGS